MEVNHRTMHPILLLLLFWVLAFASLMGAVLLLGAFSNVLESDLELGSWTKELILAAFLALVEGGTVWLIVIYLPPETRGMALRILILPALIVLVTYKLAHLGWSRYDGVLLLLFQIALGCVLATVLTGHWALAMGIVIVMVAALAAVVSFARMF